MINGRRLAAVGAVVVTATAGFAAPAQAATTGSAMVLGKDSVVRFTGGAGQRNALVITVSGRTVTLDDRVAVLPGAGCRAVRGDRTKVRCTTPRKLTELSVVLGGGNDQVANKSSVPMVAEGGTGDDVLRGGSHRDRLFGEAGNDRLYGGAHVDAIDGGPGRDRIHGGSGNDWITGDAGNDVVFAGRGHDTVFGHTGNDDLRGEAGNDTLSGGPGRDKISGGPGRDTIAS